MNEKLTIQELAAYLPWEVEVKDSTGLKLKWILHPYKDYLDSLSYGEFISLENFIIENESSSETHKLLLYPLSHLTKEIEHKGEKFVPIDFIEYKYYTQNWSDQLIRCIEDERWVFHLDYSLILHLHEWHFDTFGLIGRGKAIDKTTIQ